jgi:hypothetical protein
MSPIAWWKEWWMALSTFERWIAIAVGLAAGMLLLLLGIMPAPAAEGEQSGTNYTSLYLALIVAVPAMLSAPIMAVMSARSAAKARAQEAAVRHQERVEDWQRQDQVAENARIAAERQATTVTAAAEATRAVAAQAAEAARLLVQSQNAAADKAAEAARLLVESNAKVAAAAASTNVKLDVIHTLVNSTMTKAMQSELDATKREVLMMLEVVELKKKAGTEPNPETLSAIEVTRSKISEMEAALEDRLHASNQVVEQLQNVKPKEASNAVAGSEAAARAYEEKS